MGRVRGGERGERRKREGREGDLTKRKPQIWTLDIELLHLLDNLQAFVYILPPSTIKNKSIIFGLCVVCSFYVDVSVVFLLQ